MESYLLFLELTVAFVLLFVVPFFLPFVSWFGPKKVSLSILVGMVFSMFSSMFIVFLLVFMKQYSLLTFLLVYIPLIAAINGYVILKRNIDYRGILKSFKPVHLLLVVALVLGAYVRLWDPFTILSLGSSDSYSHLVLTKDLINNTFFGTYYSRLLSQYPRGFHAILSLLHVSTNVDAYMVVRLGAPLFGIVSIFSLYTLVARFTSRLAGGISAVAFAVFPWGTAGRVAMYRQIIATPEVLSFVVFPLIILMSMEIIKKFNDEGTIDIRYVIIFLVASTLLGFIHRMTMLFNIYFVAFVVLASLMTYRKNVFKIKNILLSGAILIYGFLVVHFYAYFLSKFYEVGVGRMPSVVATENVPDRSSVLWHDFLQMSYFNLNPALIGVLVGASIILLWGIWKRDLLKSFLGSAGLFFAVSAATDMFIIGSAMGRSVVYYVWIQSWIIGFVVASVADTSAISLVQPFSKIVRLVKALWGIWIKTIGKITKAEPKRAFSIVVVLLFFCSFIVFTPSPGNSMHPGYEKNTEIAYEICQNYPHDEIVVYSQRAWQGSTRIDSLFIPEATVYPLDNLVENRTNTTVVFNITLEKTYTFIFTEKVPHPIRYREPLTLRYNLTDIELHENVSKWLKVYSQQEDNVSVYYEDPYIAVYLIEK